MALLGFDGFDHYNDYHDLAARSGGLQFIVQPQMHFVPGRNGGKALFTPVENLNVSLGAIASTLFFGAAMNFGPSPNPLTTLEWRFSDGTPNISQTCQVSIAFSYANGAIYAWRGIANTLGGGVLLGVSPSNSFQNNAWEYFDVALTVSPTVGSILVRVNNQTVLSLTNQNTQATAHPTFDHVLFTNPPNPLLIDDMYCCDTAVGPGSFPCNDVLGDVRVQSLTPVGNSAVQWTFDGADTEWGTVPIDNLALQAITVGRDIWSSPLAAPRTGTLDHISYAANATSAANLRSAIYAHDEVSGQPGALIATSATVVAGTTAGTRFSFAFTGVHLTAGTQYWFLLQSDTTVNGLLDRLTGTFLGGAVGASYFSLTGIYGAFPNPAPVELFQFNNGVVWIPMLATITQADNWEAVSDYAMDGDETYNGTNTVGQQDLFNYQTLDGVVPSIIAVQLTGAYRKEGGGPRVINQVMNSGGTTATGSDHSIGSDYVYYYDIFPVDPHTTASWTAGGVNALAAGYKLKS